MQSSERREWVALHQSVWAGWEARRRAGHGCRRHLPNAEACAHLASSQLRHADRLPAGGATEISYSRLIHTLLPVFYACPSLRDGPHMVLSAGNEVRPNDAEEVAEYVTCFVRGGTGSLRRMPGDKAAQ